MRLKNVCLLLAFRRQLTTVKGRTSKRTCSSAIRRGAASSSGEPSGAAPLEDLFVFGGPLQPCLVPETVIA